MHGMNAKIALYCWYVLTGAAGFCYMKPGY